MSQGGEKCREQIRTQHSHFHVESEPACAGRGPHCAPAPDRSIHGGSVSSPSPGRNGLGREGQVADAPINSEMLAQHLSPPSPPPPGQDSDHCLPESVRRG